MSKGEQLKKLIESIIKINEAKRRKRKVFISYYHYDDEYYRKRFEQLFGELFQNISVKPGEIDDENSDRYIYQLIRQNKISNTTVLLVLIGNRTYCRKHVDWEIYAALDPRVGKKRAGLVGIILPTCSLFNTSIIEELQKIAYENYEDIYDLTDQINRTLLSNNYPKLPSRLLDNILSGYAKLYKWTENASQIIDIIEEAFQNRKNEYLVKNGRKQYKRNLCGD
ncbi:TIR domain-containing protein [Thermodesulfobacterium hydrogeniphilum]|uniref:TIR domain-containing protein n=1 Tax=Thermodesulfobacterium hydrogeniphilum TaxID=161156 RepID=UPI00068A62EF|nr:TIR domain-containing protein [Thermodesulfobacterium hydrogeniphilum]